jgi:hypothetical protein
VTDSERLQIAREMYLAFARGDRGTVERTFADEFSFSSPLDVGLDRDAYFDRCWPGAGRGQEFDFVRLVEAGDEVIVTYELKGRGRNTEVLTFDGDRITGVEVYFGWGAQ